MEGNFRRDTRGSVLFSVQSVDWSDRRIRRLPHSQCLHKHGKGFESLSTTRISSASHLQLATNVGASPVMVWIHGGGWFYGSGNGNSDIYGPGLFVDRDIVLVTVNYRLGPFGKKLKNDILVRCRWTMKQN